MYKDLETQRAGYHASRAKDPEKWLKRWRAAYAKNPRHEYQAKWMRAYRAAHKEEYRAANRARMRARRAKDIGKSTGKQPILPENSHKVPVYDR
jgi:hypothetical protein